MKTQFIFLLAWTTFSFVLSSFANSSIPLDNAQHVLPCVGYKTTNSAVPCFGYRAVNEAVPCFGYKTSNSAVPRIGYRSANGSINSVIHCFGPK